MQTIIYIENTMKNKNEGRLYYRELYEHHIRVNQLIYALLIF